MFARSLLLDLGLRSAVVFAYCLLAFTEFTVFIYPSAAQVEGNIVAPAQPKRPQAQRKADPIAMRVEALKQSNQRWIQIILSRQRLIAWEGKTPVYAVIVSTGKPGMDTPVGVFAIQTKLERTRMRGADYDVDSVPHTMYYDGNYAIHGTYWHHKFGTPVSHGCTNVAVDHARWLFNWARIGTPVVVQKK